MPVSSRTSRAAVCSPLSPGFGAALRQRRSRGVCRAGVIDQHLAVAHDDAAERRLADVVAVSRHSRWSAAGSWTVRRPAALRDHPRALEHGEEAATPTRARSRRAWRGRPGWRRPSTSRSSAPSARACSTSCSSTEATRLWTVWNDWLREPLVGRPQPPAERDHELDRDVGVLAHQAPHVGAEDARAARASSIASTVAERRSSSNIASSPKMSPGPKIASVIWRPSACSRIARA